MSSWSTIFTFPSSVSVVFNLVRFSRIEIRAMSAKCAFSIGSFVFHLVHFSTSFWLERPLDYTGLWITLSGTKKFRTSYWFTVKYVESLLFQSISKDRLAFLSSQNNACHSRRCYWINFAHKQPCKWQKTWWLDTKISVFHFIFAYRLVRWLASFINQFQRPGWLFY